MSQVQDTVFGIIAKEANIDIGRISLDSTLKDLDIQSLDAVQIIFEIEDQFKITLPDRDPNFDTESVKGLVEAVEKLVAEKGGSASEDNGKSKAVAQALDNIEALCSPYIPPAKLAQLVKTDPYLNGFLGLRIPLAAKLASLEQGLDENDTKEVIAFVTSQLYGGAAAYAEIIRISNDRRQSADEQFQLGFERGQKIRDYVLQNKDITTDPDYPKAMEAANSATSSAKTLGLPLLPSDTAADNPFVAISGLEYVWFGSYMVEKYS